ncbi:MULTISPECIES: HAD family hydrolase [unclassified Actinomyces]|uniref:HAD hydrolase family protein n=1 Tax=unclassified Actinomyces TaxID=2609248 RepID=UPI000D58D3A5|nr:MULTISPECIES: HAD family hydrolase [unclassified Actinomyces]RAX19755.1 HAD family phosphatase [Actinomyces sp. Z5]RAX22797.1 HAD family phosphatase [Actinomyces sp. Z3]
MRQLIATDLDGTVLFDRRVSSADLEAMQRWRDAGNLLVVDTGKSVFATRNTLTAAGMSFDYAVTFTGAVLIDGDYRVLSARYLPDGVAHEIADFLQGIDGLTVFATTMEADHILSDTYHETSPILEIFLPMTLEEMPCHRFIGVPMRVRDDDVRERIATDLTARWPDQIEVVRNQEFLDVIPAGATKGAGLSDLVDVLTGTDGPLPGERIETWSVGDSWNDIPMHVVADHAICLPWSPPDVVAACERSVGSMAELIDGLLEEAER